MTHDIATSPLKLKIPNSICDRYLATCTHTKHVHDCTDVVPVYTKWYVNSSSISCHGNPEPKRRDRRCHFLTHLYNQYTPPPRLPPKRTSLVSRKQTTSHPTVCDVADRGYAPVSDRRCVQRCTQGMNLAHGHAMCMLYGQPFHTHKVYDVVDRGYAPVSDCCCVQPCREGIARHPAMCPFYKP